MDIGKLGLVVDATGAVSSLRSFDAALARTGAEGEAVAGRLKTTLSGVGTTLKSIGPLLAVGIAVGAFKKMIAETIEAQNAMAQLEAAVKSTGGAAGLTVRQLDDLSGALQRTSTYSDEAVQGAESILLTFNKIRGDQFVEATKAVVDLSTRMGGDLKGAALQVGKALQDPEHGLTALRRAGVSFNATQSEVIKKLFETGQEAKAQQMILAELTKEFGGSAAAARGTLGGALTGLKNSFSELFELTEANTKSTVRWINALGGAFDAWKRFSERNVADFADVTGRGTSRVGVRDPIVIYAAALTDEERIAAAKKAQLEAQARLNELERISAANAGIRADEAALSARIYGGMVDTFRRVGEAAKQMREQFALAVPSAEELRASIKRNVEEALDAAAAAKKYKQEMDAIWKQGLAKILTDGTKSYRDFFEDVLQMFTRMMARMEQEGKTKGFGYKLLGLGSAAIGGAFAGYQVGQSAGGATLGALGGAASGAALGAQFAGPMGAVVGGLAGFAGGLIGGISAAAAHAKALREAMVAFRESMTTFHYAATGTTGSLEDLTRQVRATADALRREAAERFRPNAWGTGPGPRAEYAAAIAKIAADEALYVARLAEEDRLKKQYFKEDLQVRYLRATGRDAEADKLAKKQADEREYAAAVAAGADAATLAFLRTIHVAEELKKASDALSTSLRNAPSGFKIESYINRFAAGRPWEPPLGMPYNPGRPSMPYPKGGITSGGTTVNIGTVSLSLPNVTTPEKVGPAFMTYIRKVQLQTVGPNAPLADAMEYAS